jgi:predicted ATP-binding protein involved in virulence
VVAIDEVDAHQDPAIQAALVGALTEALPGVQWILTTTSPVVAGSCDTRDVLALRRLPRTTRVELYVGSEARTH